jgi:AraC-like DNA-binding protein
MKNTDLVAAVIFGAASFQGLVCILFFLFTKKGSRYANWFMLAMVTSITLIIFQNFLVFAGGYVDYPKMIFLFYPLNALIAPLFFMYVIYMISPNRKLKYYDACHLILFFIVLFEHLNFLGFPDDVKITIVNNLYYKETDMNPAVLPKIIFHKSIALSYGIACIYFLRIKLKDLKQWTSNTSIQYLNNFKLIIYLFVIYTVLFMVVYLFALCFSITIGRYEVFIHILNALIIVLISVVTSLQPERLVFLLKSPNTSKNQIKDSFSIFDGLEAIMKKEKPFLDPDLKIHDLAKLIDTPTHLLSEYINKKLNLNFFEFINQYRVNEFKQRVNNPQYEKYTLLAIALDVGFNSKASFNRIFKQQTKLTPSQYKRSK